MSNLDQLRHGLQSAVDSIAEGWRSLRERASHALTRFTHQQKDQSPTEQLMANASRWGVLAAEVKEESDAIVVKLEAPGMEPDQFDIEIVNDILVVRGHKVAEHEEKTGRYYLLERAYGAFERAIPLPAPVDESQSRATYRRGVLTITLPKSGVHLSRKIPIKAT